jgi:hypothetical protein
MKEGDRVRDKYNRKIGIIDHITNLSEFENIFWIKWDEYDYFCSPRLESDLLTHNTHNHPYTTIFK